MRDCLQRLPAGEEDSIGIMDGLDIGGPAASGPGGSEGGAGGMSTLSGMQPERQLQVEGS